MHIRAAIIALGIIMACGVEAADAQTQQTRSPLADVMKTAYEAAKVECKTAVDPYLGGALAGKVVLFDETVTDAMKANEAVPSEQDAVLLRGFMAADAKCGSAMLAFEREYMPWDVPTMEFWLASEKTIYASLAAREISFGKAMRDYANLLEHTKELRKLMLPKAGNGGALTVAQQEARQKCQAIFAAVSDPTVGGKLASGQALTETALANRDRPSEAEAATVRSIRAAHDACGRLNIEVTRTYIPWYLPVMEEEQELDDDVYSALANRRISFGEANQRFRDIAIRIGNDAKKRVEALSGQSMAAAQTRAPAQASAAPAQLASGASGATAQGAAKPLTAGQIAFQEADRRCKDAIAPFRAGPIAGKIRMTHENVTQAMLDNNDTPTEQEASVLSDFVGAHTFCQALETRFIDQYMSFMVPVHDKQVQRERPVFDALIARKSTYGEANRKLKEIEQDAIAEGDKLVQAKKTGNGDMQAFSQMLQPGAN